jgi:hypothetical protein
MKALARKRSAGGELRLDEFERCAHCGRAVHWGDVHLLADSGEAHAALIPHCPGCYSLLSRRAARSFDDVFAACVCALKLDEGDAPTGDLASLASGGLARPEDRDAGAALMSPAEPSPGAAPSRGEASVADVAKHMASIAPDGGTPAPQMPTAGGGEISVEGATTCIQSPSRRGSGRA